MHCPVQAQLHGWQVPAPKDGHDVPVLRVDHGGPDLHLLAGEWDAATVSQRIKLVLGLLVDVQGNLQVVVVRVEAIGLNFSNCFFDVSIVNLAQLGLAR